MWVADMDFRVAPPILRALRQRVDHAVFGYTRVPQAYFDAVTGWFARRHGWHFPAEWMLYTSGVVPALSAIIKALAEPVRIQPRMSQAAPARGRKAPRALTTSARIRAK